MPKTSSKRFASHLKLMVDETFGKPVADALNEAIASVKAKTTLECGFAQGTSDRELISKAKKLDRVLLTFDHNTIDKRRYPPCSHAGIIIIKDKQWTKESIVRELSAFGRSGNRKLVIHSVTYLHRDHAVVHQHDGKQEPISF